MLRIARKGSVRIIGPNCMGLYCPESGLSFRADLPNSPGATGMISQSGGMAIRTIFHGTEKGVGFSKVVSYGNESDLQSWEILDYLAQDKKTRLILVYIEGTQDGRALARSLKEASQKKPSSCSRGGFLRREIVQQAPTPDPWPAVTPYGRPCCGRPRPTWPWT